MWKGYLNFKKGRRGYNNAVGLVFALRKAVLAKLRFNGAQVQFSIEEKQTKVTLSSSSGKKSYLFKVAETVQKVDSSHSCCKT